MSLLLCNSSFWLSPHQRLVLLHSTWFLVLILLSPRWDLLQSLLLPMWVNIHWKFERSVLAPKCQFSPAGQSLIQPFLEPFEHNLGQKSSIKRLFQPTVGPISALGPNQPYLIGLYWPWFKRAKLDSKIGLYFTHRNGPIFRAKTDLSDLECTAGKVPLPGSPAYSYRQLPAEEPSLIQELTASPWILLKPPRSLLFLAHQNWPEKKRSFLAKTGLVLNVLSCFN